MGLGCLPLLGVVSSANGWFGSHSRPGRLRFLALEPTFPFQYCEQLIVVHVSGGGNNTVAAIVAALMQDLEVVRRQGAERFRRTQDRVAVRMIGPERFGVQL